MKPNLLFPRKIFWRYEEVSLEMMKNVVKQHHYCKHGKIKKQFDIDFYNTNEQSSALEIRAL